MNTLFANRKNGITLLLAVLILSSVLSIALGIFHIVLIEIQINQSARESYRAYYSALTGMECARYYHVRAHPTKDYSLTFWDPEYPCFGSGFSDIGACAPGIEDSAPPVWKPEPDANVFCAGARVKNFKTWTPDCDKELTPELKDDCNAGLANGQHSRDYEFDINESSSGIFTTVTIHAMSFFGPDGPGTKYEIESRGRNSDSTRAVNRSMKICSSTAGNPDRYCPSD